MKIVSLLLTCWLVGVQAAWAVGLPAFPGAEGEGTETTHARGGRVVFVTNVNDSGPGSLRAALAESGRRFVVFSVSGTIVLDTPLVLREPHVYVAGQTAPGDGVCLKNAADNALPGLIIATHDVVIRHLRIRQGAPRPISDKTQGLGIEDENAYRIVVDHCSLSWSTDQLAHTWKRSENDLGYPFAITFSYNIFSECLYEANHPKGPHSKGPLLARASKISFHHNLMAHNHGRNPRLVQVNQTGERAGPIDVRNNVIYNFRHRATEVSNRNGHAQVNYVGNYIRCGPDSGRYEAPPLEGQWRHPLICDVRENEFGLALYIDGNLDDKHRHSDDQPNRLTVFPRHVKYMVDRPHPAAPVTTQPAADAYRLVLREAGATRPKRDAVDRRIVAEVQAGTGQIINRPEEVGGWPEYRTEAAPRDTDHDGMPDRWERDHGLDPDSAQDANLDPDGDGYDNIEEYLNATNPCRP